MDILYVIGLILFLIFTSIKGKKAGEANKPSTHKPFGEIFPEVEEWSMPEPIEVTEAEVVRESRPNEYFSASGSRKEHIQEKAFEKQEKPHTPSVSTTSDEGIQLHTAEEARRAFIYSEIFRRKYD